MIVIHYVLMPFKYVYSSKLINSGKISFFSVLISVRSFFAISLIHLIVAPALTFVHILFLFGGLMSFPSITIKLLQLLRQLGA